MALLMLLLTTIRLCGAHYQVGKPVAYDFGPLGTNNGLLWGMLAYSYGLLWGYLKGIMGYFRVQWLVILGYLAFQEGNLQYTLPILLQGLLFRFLLTLAERMTFN